MRVIDLESWPRRDHFLKFKDFHRPIFDMSANVDLSRFRPLLGERGVSFTAAVVYVLARAANDIPEFRWRIRGESVVEHDVVSPSLTVLVDDDLFSFCYFDYTEDFPVFAEQVAGAIAGATARPTLDELGDRDDLLFMTVIPWVSYTSFSHPMPTSPMDSIPRLAWGKVFEEGGRVKMPLSVQVHHALADGLHVGRFYEKVQSYLDDPEVYLG